MEPKKIGYVEVQFTPETHQQVVAWAHTIKNEDLVTATIDGKTEGGNVTDKLHLTLFYGFDDERLDKDKLSEFINQIKLKDFKVSGLGIFPVKEYDCYVLYLRVEDNDNELKKIYMGLKEFSHFSEYQKFEYTPHITVAYVKKDFNLDAIKQNLPKILYVHKTHYAISSTANMAHI